MRTLVGIGNVPLAHRDVASNGHSSGKRRRGDETRIAEELFGRTVECPSPLNAITQAGSTFGRRSTVLPRVKMVGTEPRLVANEQARYETVRFLGAGGLGEVVGARDNDI